VIIFDVSNLLVKHPFVYLNPLVLCFTYTSGFK